MTRDLPVHPAIPPQFEIEADGFTIVRPWGDGNAYREIGQKGLRVIVSTADYDGQEWMHISVSREDRLPSWAELHRVKEVFAGKTTYAYQVIQPADKHVNIHENCLHLWVPLMAEPPLPDFTRGLGTI